MARAKNNFRRRLKAYLQIHGGLSEFTPGMKIVAVHRGRTVFRGAFGKTYRYYDLASLTKIIFSVSAAMRLVEQKKLSLDQPIQNVWPPLRGSAKVRHLLSHQAHLDWWRPFFKNIRLRDPVQVRWQKVAEQISQSRTRKVAKAIYSDLDLLVLAMVFGEVSQQPLLELYTQLQRHPAFKQIFFQPNNKRLHPKSQYAPTERCKVRKKVMQGQVHDENCFFLGGVSTHAGLFGTLTGVERYLKLLRNTYRGNADRRFVQPQTLRKFVRRQMPSKDGDFALGFMLPTKGKASCGHHFSRKSFGHLGFTGTSLWYDPVRDFGVVILSNRVHPTRENTRFNQLRPLIHDWLVEEYAM